MFENVSYEGINFTELVNMIIKFVLAIVTGEWEELGKILNGEEAAE